MEVLYKQWIKKANGFLVGTWVIIIYMQIKKIVLCPCNVRGGVAFSWRYFESVSYEPTTTSQQWNGKSYWSNCLNKTETKSDWCLLSSFVYNLVIIFVPPTKVPFKLHWSVFSFQWLTSSRPTRWIWVEYVNSCC